MSRLFKLAQNDINNKQNSSNNKRNNFNDEQMTEIIKYIDEESAKILNKFNSFLNLMAKINRLIININDKYMLNPEIEVFTMQEFANITFYGFEAVYQRISHQDLNNVVKNLERLKNINIKDDFNELSIDEKENICTIIFDNIDTQQIQIEMFNHIGHIFSSKIEKVISVSDISQNYDNWSYYIDIAYAFNNYARIKRLKPLSPSFLIAWIRTNQTGIIRKINHIIHNTVPITYDNSDEYDWSETPNKNGTNPNTWISYSDENDPIHGTRESDTAPMYFSSIRLSPLVVLDDEVLFSDNKETHHNELIDKYKKEHQINKTTEGLAYTDGVKSILEEFGAQNMAIGSLFEGKIALLEYITDGKEEEIIDENNLIRPNNGNPSVIIKSLRNRGIKKVYIQNVSPWVSREYERIASPKYNKFQRLMKKVLG